MKFLIPARYIAIFVLGVLACNCFSQSKFYGTVRPEALVVVRKHPMGSDLVEITYQGADYPGTAISAMLVRLGKALGNEPRSLITTADDKVVKASFAVVGLITDSNPKVNLAALAVALAFGERPIRSFSVFFDGMAPDQNTPKKWFPENNAWMMEGVSMSSPKGLDYRVKVNTNDPNEIYMPDSKHPTVDSGKPVTVGQPKLFILGGIFLGAVAVGLLVYSALMRPRSKGR
jgi:hypothetical protein